MLAAFLPSMRSKNMKIWYTQVSTYSQNLVLLNQVLEKLGCDKISNGMSIGARSAAPKSPRKKRTRQLP
jgi:hypothetical protein